MKKLLALTLVLGAFILSDNAFASVTASGKVARIYPSDTQGGLVYFRLHDSTCSPKGSYFSIYLGSEAGKAWYSLILAAASTGAEVQVSVNKCPTSSEIERVRYIFQDFAA